MRLRADRAARSAGSARISSLLFSKSRGSGDGFVGNLPGDNILRETLRSDLSWNDLLRRIGLPQI